MRICVLADGQLKTELLEKKVPAEVEIIWADTVKVLHMVSDIDAYFDLEFSYDSERIERLSRLSNRPVFINAVTETLKEIDSSLIRINAWPTMLRRDVTEIAVNNSLHEPEVASVFQTLNWSYRVVPDVPGMITPRVIAMIINEAYYTLEQEVSSKKEIDIAMKLGTNYPFGPFEWSEKIGLSRIHSLLERLSRMESRYTPCDLLVKEARQTIKN